FGDVEIARADVRLARRIVVVDQGDLLVGVRFARELGVAQPAADRDLHPLPNGAGDHRREAGGRIATLLLRAHNRWGDRAGKFGRGQVERALEGGQTAGRTEPLLLAAAV